MRTRVAIAMAVSCAMLLAGCTAPPVGRTPLDRLPDGVTASVSQGRSDYAARRVSLAISNTGDAGIVVTGVELDSTQFTEPARWEKDSATIPAGATRDLRMLLAEPACIDGPPVVRAIVDFRLDDGSFGRAVVTPDDPLGRLVAIDAEDCLTGAVDRAATIRPTGPPTTATLNGRLVARLELVIQPTGAEGSVTLDAVAGTVLLTLADPATAEPVVSVPLGVVVGEGSAATSVVLTIVPGRCDPHAIAEDKRGTFLPLTARAGSRGPGTVYVPVDDATRSAFYAFVQQACAG